MKKKSIQKAECHSKISQTHPDHSVEVSRLRRVCGQVEGVERMISERRYCTDILIQVRAATEALRTIERRILGRHLRACVKDALSSRNEHEIEAKIDELMKLFGSHTNS